MAENDIKQGIVGEPALSDLPGSKPPSAKSTESRPLDYAFWEAPGSSYKVIYSLSLFHEIDFVVNEGYRKIPHGGIEEGGLLFGAIDENSVRIEAYRSIVCEHVTGPSFVLSERDMANLELQLVASSSDPDLENMRPLGWFLAHTRGPLSLTDLEATQFDKLFPQVSRLAVLIKPERFQPTRFGFLVRDANRNMPRDATASAVILPLPGRSHKANSLIPSIPAPAPSVNARRLADAAENGVPVEAEEPLTPPRRRLPSERAKAARAEDPLQSIWKVPPEDDATEEADPKRFVREEEPKRKAAPPPADDPRFQSAPEQLSEPEELTDLQRAARKQVARDRTRVIEESLDLPPRAPKAQPQVPTLGASRTLPERTVSPEVYEQFEEFKSKSSEPIFNSRSLNILAIAALLGCLVGYIGYLLLPAPVIVLEVRGHMQGATVSWPSEETRHAMYASIRINGGDPVLLSPVEKFIGRSEIDAPGDVKVEIFARNWMRDSRGVVHYLRSANGNANVLPSDSR